MAVEYETLVQGGHSKFAEEIFKKIAPVEVESDEGNPITIVTDSAQIAKNTHLTFEPIQDLHGYNHPWPAGGGKNKFPNNTDPDINSSGMTVEKLANGYKLTATNTAQWQSCTWVVIDASACAGKNVSFNALGIYSGGAHLSRVRIEYDDAGGTKVLAVAGDLNQGCVLAIPDGATGTIKAQLYLSYGQDCAVGDATTFYNIQFEEANSPTTFAPYSNICPISGIDEVEAKRTGFNVWDEEWEVGGTFNSKNFIPVLPNTTYYISCGTAQTYPDFHWYNANKEKIGVKPYIANKMFTTPDGCYYIKFRLNASYGTTYKNDICINISDPDKNGTYEPYQGQEVSVTLPETVYSGTLDLETGVLTVDAEINQYTGDETWYASSTYRFYIVGQRGIIRCNQYRLLETKVDYASEIPSGAIAQVISGAVYISDERFNSAAEWKAHLSDLYNSGTPLKVIRKLATPITYTLTQKQLTLLKGTNHISANAKTVKVTFRNGKFATLEDINAANSNVDAIKTQIEDLGLCVQNGLLCAKWKENVNE